MNNSAIKGAKNAPVTITVFYPYPVDAKSVIIVPYLLRSVSKPYTTDRTERQILDTRQTVTTNYHLLNAIEVRRDANNSSLLVTLVCNRPTYGLARVRMRIDNRIQIIARIVAVGRL